MKQFKDFSIRVKFFLLFALNFTLMSIIAFAIIYFLVIAPLNKIDADYISIPISKRFLLKGFILFLLVTLSIIFFSTFAIVAFILRPLAIFRKTIADIQSTKDMTRRIKIESANEIGALSKDFNTLMEELHNSQEQLIQAHQRLVETEKMSATAELAMGMVHQINNPLSIVFSRAQMLSKEQQQKAKISGSGLQNDLKIIETQTMRAMDITNRLLNYAKPMSFKFQECDIYELLHEVIGSVINSFKEQNIEIIENFQANLPLVQYCDPEHMQDVFINIITNAKQAMPNGGMLEVSAGYDKNENTVRIIFTDTGEGIAPENLKKIFIPFFSTNTDRSGLGLPISYNIVKGHGGDIQVKSRLGEGTTFTIKLPVAGLAIKEGQT